MLIKIGKTVYFGFGLLLTAVLLNMIARKCMVQKAANTSSKSVATTVCALARKAKNTKSAKPSLLHERK